MEPKVIGVISNNLEVVRKVVEGRSEETKKTFHDILVGADVQGIVQKVLDKMDEMKEVSVQMDESMNRVRTIIKKNNDLLSKNDTNEKLLETLTEISSNVAAILKKTGTPQLSPETKKSMDKLLVDAQKNPKMDRIMQMVSLLSQLKELSIKDFMFAKTKIKHLEKVYDQVESIMAKYKDEKQIKKVHEFVASSTKLVKELSKIVPLTKLAQLGGKGLDKILFGKNGGLVGLFARINKEEKTIKKVKKNIDLIIGGCRRIAELALIMASMIVIAPIAMVGVLFCTGLLWSLTLLSKFMESNNKRIDKGNISIGKLMLGMLFLAGSILLIYQTVKNMEWETFGKMAATIGLLVGVALIVGELQKPISKGVATLVIMGIGYITLGVAMLILYDSTKNMEWKQFAMIASMIGLLMGVALVAGIGPIPGMIMMGSVALLLMGAAFVILGIGMGKLYNAVKGVEFKDLGLLAATIGTFGVIAAGLGIPVVFAFVALGCIAFSLIGLSLIVLSKGVEEFGKRVTDDAIQKIAKGIPRILDAMTSMFKSDKENPSFGDSLISIIIGALKLGGAIFAAGALLFIGFALGFVADSLGKWANFNTKAIDNLEYAIGRINKIFKLDGDGAESGALGSIGGEILGIIVAVLKFGKTFFQMGTLLLVAFTMGMIYDNLDRWKNFDLKAIDNFEFVYGKIREIFKLDDSGGKLGDIGSGLLGLISAAMQFGKTLFQMGTIAMAVHTMGLVYDETEKWANYNMKSIDNFEEVYKRIRKIFKLDDDKKKSLFDSLFGGLMEAGSAMLKAGKTFMEMGTILVAVNTMCIVYDQLQKWETFNMKSLDNFETVYKKIREIFKLDKEKKGGLFDSLFGSMIEAGSAMLNQGKTFAEMGTILVAVHTMCVVYDQMQKWSVFNMKSIDNFGMVYNRLRWILKLDDDRRKGIDMPFVGIFGMTAALLKAGGIFYEMGVLLTATQVMSKIYEELPKWSIFDFTCIDNFEIAVQRLRKVLLDDYEDASDNAKDFKRMTRDLMLGVTNVTKYKKHIPSFTDLSVTIMSTLNRWSQFDYVQQGESMGMTLEKLFKIIEKPGFKYTANVATTIGLLKTLKGLQRFNGTLISRPMKTIVDAVNRVEMDKIDALTDLFDAFTKMKNKSIFTPFKNSVDEFTKACIQLIEAINGNTDALNTPDDESGNPTETTSSQQNTGTSVKITNIEELAQMLAERMTYGRGYIGGSGPTTIDLRINGQGGDRWVLTRY